MNKKLFARAFSILFAIVLVVCVGIAPQSVSAAEISAEAQNVVTLIKKLPTDTKTITIDNKADIVAAKLAYNALTPEQKIEISTDYLIILNGDFSAVMPLLLANLVDQMKSLPEADKIEESEKDNIVSLYTDYQLLDENAKGAFSKQHKEKLLSAVSRLAPDELSEKDAEEIKALEEAKAAEEKEKKEKEAAAKAARKETIKKIWQYALIIFVTIIVLCSFAAMIILIIKLIKLSR